MSRSISTPTVVTNEVPVVTSADALVGIKQVDGVGSGLDVDSVRGRTPVANGEGPRDIAGTTALGWTGANVTVEANGVDKGDIAEVTDLRSAQFNKLDIPEITHISNSGHNVITILADGTLFTTSGNNSTYSNYGLGRRTGTGQASALGVNNLSNVVIPSDSPIVDIGVSGNVGYALLANKELWGWGHNANGRLGLGHSSPVGIPTLSNTNVEEVYTHGSNGGYQLGDSRLFIRKTDGNIYGAGYNGQGQLGIGNTTTQTSWIQITALGTNQVSKLWNFGTNYGCVVALMTDGRILAAGHNGYGQLGIGNTTNQSSFIDVTTQWAGVSNVLDLKVSGAFGYYNTGFNGTSNLIMLITLSTGNIVRTSGHNARGQLGDGTTTQRTSPVAPVGLPTDIVDIAAINVMSCQALSSTGDLWAWGHNVNGQVGVGNVVNQTQPQLVKTNIAKLHSDGWNAWTYGYRIPVFIEDNDGQLWAVGENNGGECGVGAVTTYVTSYTRVLLPKDEQVHLLGFYTSNAAVSIMVCVTKQGNVYVWGSNNDLGVINKMDGSIPVTVPLNMEVPKINKTLIY